jgi:hypothetical protein
VSVTRAAITAAAKGIAQDPGGGNALLLAAGDYDLAIAQAIEAFRSDRPNVRVVHYTVPAAGFRFILFGTGLILPTTGLDRWIDGGSQLRTVYQPYVADYDNYPLERNAWRVRREPGPLEVLELLGGTASAGTVLRLEFTAPHTVGTLAADTSILEADVNAFEVLVAAKICSAASRRYVQNTGTSTFQNESVDRRTQSDMMASRAKELLTQYGSLVGRDEQGSLPAAAIVKRFDVEPTHARARLWPRG